MRTTRRRSLGGPLLQARPLVDEDDSEDSEQYSLRQRRLSIRELRSVKAELAESERARAAAEAELAMARRSIAYLEAELEDARRHVAQPPRTPPVESESEFSPLTPADEPKKEPSPLVVPPSPYVVAKTPGGRVRENPTSETRSFQLTELPSFQVPLDDDASLDKDVSEDSPGRLPSTSESSFSSPKEPSVIAEEIADALRLLECCEKDEDAAEKDEGFFRPAEDMGEWLEKTASLAAFEVAARKVGLLESDGAQKLSRWVRAAVSAEAEHVSRAHRQDHGGRNGRVRFRRYDFSSVALPIDTVPGSEREAEAVATRLAAVREAGRALDDEARASLARLEAGLRLSAEEHDAREARGAAIMWADEAASVLSRGESYSPVVDKLSELLSSVIRFHLRRLFNAPPLPTAKRAQQSSPQETEETRAPLATIVANDNQVNSAAAEIQKSGTTRQRRRDSLGGRGEVEEDHNPYAWSRSDVYKHVKLAPNHEAVGAPEGALASQLVVALGHLAAAGDYGEKKRSRTKKLARPDDVLTARHRLESLGPRLVAACATRFLYRLLDFPDLDRLVDDAGGWGPVEAFANMAVSYASEPVAVLFQPCANIDTFKAYLGERIQKAEVDRKKLLAETNELGVTFGPRRRLPGARDIGDQARALARTARAYPECLLV